MAPQLAAAVAAWRAEDPDPATAAALDVLVERAGDGDEDARAELVSAFAGPLEFGTAGLRGPLGPGPARMNRVVVTRAAAGLAAWLQQQRLSGGTVLVGHDARYNSDVFARDTCEVLAGAGFDAVLVDRPVPTPVVAFGLRHLGCVAGVVVTASHNPPQDNGYKVYLGDGSQIVPPVDTQIAAEIARVAERPLAGLPRSSGYRVADETLLQAYVARAASLVGPEAPRQLDWVYTPLHGVGAAVVDQVVGRIGFTPGRPVAQQVEPDPDFPTVDFPNPEEPGAIDLALALAAQQGADLVVANDPDADRCAVAVPGAGGDAPGGWRMLRGDELGALLADDALQRGVTGVYARSVVSSSLLDRLAAAAGQPSTTTLTGFKWIGRVPGLAFGYEEALGYCCDPRAVADKDGITALVRVLALAARLRAEGSTLLGRLEELARTHGLHATDQLSVRVRDLAVISTAMSTLRAAPPAELLGEPTEVVDLAAGSEQLPPTDAVLLRTSSTQVVVRPSGTEPKLKCYLEVRLSPAESADVPAARVRAAGLLATLREEMAAALGL
ncbi:phospho-sugar mutase [Auraticoccus sp. F435]|uniref:Phospho-sugar mutase n=1 Tax=Auraticoccus cholistanensis TaxID=2656650 RepID=A0A6A9UU34_9ACTN|nr:phospho-sugar mutase [Auraticoccus cholistanensis]MVA76436.1 phospho-sugar mutase [Auraticoccus cholistanensis]